MFAKLMMGAAAVLAAALSAYLGTRLITAYGDARYQSGLVAGRLAQVQDVLTANAQAAQAGLSARDRIIAAESAHGTALARLIPQILSAQDKANTYAATVAGRAICLGADRVRGIEADRGALFPASAAVSADRDPTGSVPADAAADAIRP
jgi:hypothetical protein